MPLLRRSAQFIAGALGAGLLLASSPSEAAETVIVKYGPLRESISVAELDALAQTGEPSPALSSYLRLANKEPAEVQQLLNRSIKADAVQVDRFLNSPLGTLVLDQAIEAIQTPSGGADRQALRAALVLSASEDGEITLIEALKNYPTREVVVEGEKLVAAAQKFSRFQRQADKVRDLLKLL